MIATTSTPTRRRFGQGVARLPIGAPRSSVAIAEAARRPLPGESLTVVAPLLAIALLALVVFGRSTPPESEWVEASETPETWIEIEAWPEPESLEAPQPVAPRVARVEPQPPTTVEPRAPTTTDTAPVTDQTSIEGTPDLAEAPARRSLDPRTLLAATAPTIPAMATMPTTATVSEARAKPTRPGPNTRPRPGGLPTARALSDLPVALVQSASPSSDAWVPEASDDARVVAATSDARRRELAGAAGDAPSPAWQVAAERQAFLAGVADEAAAPRRAGSRATALPRVSARQQIENEAAIRRAWAAEGWHEVPLDALPDCSPPGRQDALKRRILAAAPSGSACTSTAGSFRFLETRNLNAFLMWSRTHPAGDASPQRVENVCDVLERALHCLASPATKELDPR